MDSLIYPQPTPAPLILPRRASVHSRKSLYPSSADNNSNGRRGSPLGNSSDSSNHNNHNGSPPIDSLSRNPLTHYFYFPTTLYPPPPQSQKQPSTLEQQQQQQQQQLSGNTGAGVTTNGLLDITQEDYLSSINMQRKPPAIFAFGNERGTTAASTAVEDLSGFLSTPSLAAIRSQTHRRHSVGSFDRPYLRRSSSVSGSGAAVNGAGGFSDLIQSIAESEEENDASLKSRILWTTIPPRHALHMPIMKINPEIWRSESHNREIYRLMHEARERLIMKRRNIKAVMDTSEDGEEEPNPDDGPGMADVVMTMDFGGWHALEEQEKEKVREQVMKEWKALVEREYMAMVQREQQQQLLREQQQLQQEARRNSWPPFVDPQQWQQYQRMQQLQMEQSQLEQRMHEQQQASASFTPQPSYPLAPHNQQAASSEQLQRLQQLQLQQRLQQQQQQIRLSQQKWNTASTAPDMYGTINQMPEHLPPPGLQGSSTYIPPEQQPRTLSIQTTNLAPNGGAATTNGSWSTGIISPASNSSIHSSWASTTPTSSFDTRRASFTEYRK
ncbi:hypothetical protein BGW42_007019 [Actinomortierella wolfii]|nr:hypothetical protein BGW42_007019 [Actinomortierella wolfii]